MRRWQCLSADIGTGVFLSCCAIFVEVLLKNPETTHLNRLRILRQAPHASGAMTDTGQNALPESGFEAFPMAHLPEKLPIVSSSGDAGSGPMTKLELVAVNADAQQQLLKLGLRFDAQGMRAREEEENFLVPAHSGRAALRTRQASWKRPRAEATLSSVPLRTHSERSWQQGGDENAHHGSDNTPLDDAVILIQA